MENVIQGRNWASFHHFILVLYVAVARKCGCGCRCGCRRLSKDGLAVCARCLSVQMWVWMESATKRAELWRWGVGEAQYLYNYEYHLLCDQKANKRVCKGIKDSPRQNDGRCLDGWDSTYLKIQNHNNINHQRDEDIFHKKMFSIGIASAKKKIDLCHSGGSVVGDSIGFLPLRMVPARIVTTII